MIFPDSWCLFGCFFVAVFSVFSGSWQFSEGLPASWCGFAGSCQFLVVFHGKALLFLAGFQLFFVVTCVVLLVPGGFQYFSWSDLSARVSGH